MSHWGQGTGQVSGKLRKEMDMCGCRNSPSEAGQSLGRGWGPGSHTVSDSWLWPQSPPAPASVVRLGVLFRALGSLTRPSALPQPSPCVVCWGHCRVALTLAVCLGQVGRGCRVPGDRPLPGQPRSAVQVGARPRSGPRRAQMWGARRPSASSQGS